MLKPCKPIENEPNTWLPDAEAHARRVEEGAQFGTVIPAHPITRSATFKRAKQLYDEQMAERDRDPQKFGSLPTWRVGGAEYTLTLGYKVSDAERAITERRFDDPSLQAIFDYGNQTVAEIGRLTGVLLAQNQAAASPRLGK